MVRVEYSPLIALFTVMPGLRSAGDETVSVYAPARAEGYDQRYYDIVVGDLLHRYQERLDGAQLEVLERELPRIRERIGATRPAGCAAIAAFAETRSGLLGIIPLPMTTAERLDVGAPLLAPALRQLEAVPPVLVVALDKERARTFQVILGKAVEIAHVAGARVAHSKAGGTSAQSNQRKADNVARANLALVVDQAGRLLGSGAFEGVFVAGPDEARAEFDRLLPSRLRQASRGQLGLSLDSATLVADIEAAISEGRPAARV